MYRTDLAVENVEIQKEKGISPGEKDGIIINKSTCGQVNITKVKVISTKGEALIGKPIGNYVTLETNSIVDLKEDDEKDIVNALAQELKKYIKFHYYLKVLIVGLGNEQVTPDALGPKSARQVLVTRHLFHIYDCDGDEEMSQVSCLAPGVMATSGMETAQQIAKAVEIVKPEVVLVIDALAARNVERINTTIQISDSGISPGAGMGNYRQELNEKSLGTRVVAVGVPTVIDSKNLIIDAMKEAGIAEESIKAYLERKDFDMVVATTDIDLTIEKFSRLIGKAINITLHPGIYS